MTMQRARRDAIRIVALIMAATIFLAVDEPLALALRRPELAPWLMFAGLSLYGAALASVLLRIYFPYMDGKTVMQKAMEAPLGAAIVFLARAVVLAALLMTLPSLVKADELPRRAREYIPILQSEQYRLWPELQQPPLLAAQVEQETCPSLRHRQCWNPRAELKTSREQGVGLGQVTRTARFDTLAELRKSYRMELADWAWDSESLYDPRMQLRGLVLGDLQCWRVIRGAATERDRLAFTFAGYNGGLGGVASDRKLCGGTPGCDSRIWFGNVERTSLKAKTVASGYGRSFFDVNRDYVRNIMVVRVKKYEAAYEHP